MLPPGKCRYTYPIADRLGLLYTVELWRYWSGAHQIYIRCSLIITGVNVHIPIHFQMLVQRMQVVSIHLEYFLVSPKIIWSKATSLDKLANKVKIDHLHPQCFHMVKRLWKSVQYILRYLTKYVGFCRVIPDVHKWALSTLELLDQSSRNFYTI